MINYTLENRRSTGSALYGRTVGIDRRRSLEEGAVDKLLVGELGVEGVQQEGGQQDRHTLPLPKS